MPVPVQGAEEASAVPKAGHIVAGSGRLIARAPDGTERRLRRRSPIYAGETLIVGENAFIQVRFTDGGLVSLRPGSEFRVNEYSYDGKEDGSEKAMFELVKGGLRTITGAIGKKNKENYEVKTPVSTIGIRGTHYGLRLCAGGCSTGDGKTVTGGLYGGVVDGAIVVRNQGGEKAFGNDHYFHVSDSLSAPRELVGPPGIVFDRLDGGTGQEQQEEGDEPPPDASPEAEAAPAEGEESPPEGEGSEPLPGEEAGAEPTDGEPTTEEAAAPEGEPMPAPAEGEEQALLEPATDQPATQDGEPVPIGPAPEEQAMLPPPEDQALLSPSGEQTALPPPDDPLLLTGEGDLTTSWGSEPTMTGPLPPPPMDGPLLPQEPVFTATGSNTDATALGLKPAPLGAVAGIAALWHVGDTVAEMVPQKGTPENEVYIDTVNGIGNVVVRVVHRNPAGSVDCVPQCEINRGTATLYLPSVGGDTVGVNWGRWDGDWYGTDGAVTGVGAGSWHYIYSPNITKPGELDVLTDTSAVFNYAGGTSPTDNQGVEGSFTASTTMTVNFPAHEISYYRVEADFTANSTYSLNGTMDGSPVPFMGSVTDVPLTVSCTGSCAGPPGAGHAGVTFLGSTASAAMNSVEMHSGDGSKAVVGTFLLKQ